MSSRRLPLRRGSTVCALVLLAAGCAGQQPADPVRVDAVEPQLTAVAVYGRHAAVRGKVDVRIANLGQAPVEVEHYRVEHPLFEPVPAHARRSNLPPDGEARIVPVPFGEPRCDATDPDGARVLVGVRSGDGVREVAVPLVDGEPGLVRAHRLACAAADVRAAVGLDLGPWSLEPGPVARTTLRLQRRGPGQVAVTGLGGNILFTVDSPPVDPLLALPDGQDAAEVEVRVRASRCEAHALTESKTSFTFPLFAALDGGEPVQVQLTAGPEGQAALQELLDRTC